MPDQCEDCGDRIAPVGPVTDETGTVWYLCERCEVDLLESIELEGE